MLTKPLAWISNLERFFLSLGVLFCFNDAINHFSSWKQQQAVESNFSMEQQNKLHGFYYWLNVLISFNDNNPIEVPFSPYLFLYFFFTFIEQMYEFLSINMSVRTDQSFNF